MTVEQLSLFSQLNAPFPIHSYQYDSFGQRCYVSGQSIIERLNEVFGVGFWKYRGLHSTEKLIEGSSGKPPRVKIYVEFSFYNPDLKEWITFIDAGSEQFARPPRSQKTVDDIENQEQTFKYLEKDELSLFLKTAKEQGLERDYVIFLTLAYSGMRVGELCALKWSDLIMDDYTLKITKTYYNPRNVTTEYQLLTPKTTKSVRTIELDPIVFKELTDHKDRQNEIRKLFKDTYHDKDFIFAKTENYKGYPELIKTIHNRMRRLLKLAGLIEKLSPHSLRHTHVSLLAEAGADIFQIIERLGHSSDEQIRTVYLHVTKSSKKEATKKFSELMKNL